MVFEERARIMTKDKKKKSIEHTFSEAALAVMVDHVLDSRADLYRDFAWRRTQDPYEVLVSEVMLQQTQTQRVVRYFERWIEKFPTFDALASAAQVDVLEAWQGLGYNRRCLALYRCAQEVSEKYHGECPRSEEELCSLPGIGPATAAGVRAFAFNEPSAYLETNVRTVVLHELWPEEEGVSDRSVLAAVQAAAVEVESRGIDARLWNYALLDYGAWLKKVFPNPSRRSKHHTKQSAYEGSRRQKRASLLRQVLDSPGGTAAHYAKACKYEVDIAEDVLSSLVEEGFVCREENETYTIAH